MLILCLFIQEVAGLFSAGEDSRVITLADNFMSRLDNNLYDELASEMPYGAERETGIVIDILKEMYEKSELFRPLADMSVKGLDLHPETWEPPDGFGDNYSRYYEMYLADHEYVFENYLVHRVLSEGFPFNYKSDSDIMSNFVDLLAKFDLVEFLFTGMCRNRMKFDKRYIIECITLFTRGYEHSYEKFLQT